MRHKSTDPVLEEIKKILNYHVSRWLKYLSQPDYDDICQESYLEHLLHPDDLLHRIVDRVRHRYLYAKDLDAKHIKDLEVLTPTKDEVEDALIEAMNTRD